MIGKPYMGKPYVRFEMVNLNGHETGNGGYSQGVT